VVFESKQDLSAKDYEHALSYEGENYVLYTHSYLGYGLNEARKKMIGFAKGAKKTCVPLWFESSDSEVPKGSEFEFSDCVDLSLRIFDKQSCTFESCSFNQVYQPSLEKGHTNTIYAFSYFFDRISALVGGSSTIHTITPLKVRDLGERLCSDKSNSLLKENPFYCMELAFIYNLWTVGYEIKEHQPVHLAKKIENYETGWCLGATIEMLDKFHCQ
jgi:guanosine-diphosphatase